MDRAPSSAWVPPRGRRGASYDRLSRWYDLLAGHWEEGVKRQALSLLEARPGERVLDVGCGTGREVAALASKGGSIWGVDLSAGMLRAASARLCRLGVRDRVVLLRADALRLPVRRASFDASLLCFSLELFPDVLLRAVLGEVHRALRPEGRLCVVSLSLAGGASLMRRLYQWGHERFPALLDCRPIHAQAEVRQAGFAVWANRLTSVGGLPVEITVARAEHPQGACPAGHPTS